MSDKTLPDLPYVQPAAKIKTLDVSPVPSYISEGLEKYQDAARGYYVRGFEELQGGDAGPARVYIAHRPLNEQVMQLFRMPYPGHRHDDTELERITHFNLGTGRSITCFTPIVADDWHGVLRPGGAIFAMDLDGSEVWQLWRLWENCQGQTPIPTLENELDNTPGACRIERLTNDSFRYSQLIVSCSNKLLVYSSTKENGVDTLIYVTRLVDSDSIGVSGGRLITPVIDKENNSELEPIWWAIMSVSVDDQLVALTQSKSASYRPLYIVNITDTKSPPTYIDLPGATSPKEGIAVSYAVFSRNPNQPEVLYLVTNAYGDFDSFVIYDVNSRVVTHITTPDPGFNPLHPIPWDTEFLLVTDAYVYFTGNLDGWDAMFVYPLVTEHKGKVIELKFDQEVCSVTSLRTNSKNGEPWNVVFAAANSKTASSIYFFDVREALKTPQSQSGKLIAEVILTPYPQAQAPVPEYRTLSPQLLRYKSFDDLEVPVIYYHPEGRRRAVPLVIIIHGGPAAQSTALSRTPIDGYLLNELNCAIMYPNVRGSSGYGKRYMALDDVEKREDSVKDIGSLLDYIKKNMANEILIDRIAVMGGSYGGYMVYACLVHFSPQLRCGVATCPIGDWNAFLKNTAKFRQANRRKEYGDETDPVIAEFLKKISPLNHADEISIPLLTGHGENDTRVPVEEAIHMWEMVKKNGVYSGLVIAEKEGHVFKQKAVIDYWQAARVAFLKQWLLS